MPGPTYWGGHILPRVEVLPARGDGIILCDYQGTAWAVYPDGTNAQLGSGGGGSGYVTGAAMTDANQTLQAGTDAVSEYDLAAAVLTASRNKTLGVTSVLAGQVLMLKVFPQAQSLVVINGGPAAGTLVTLAANAKIVGIQVSFNGSDWVNPVLSILTS